MCSEANSTEESNFKASQAFTTTLQNDYSQAFKNNQAILGNLTTTLNNAIAKPQGFTSQEQAALRTGAMDTTTQQFAGAKVAAGAAAARYGGDVASGVTGQIMGGIAGEQAATNSQEQNQISVQNAELQRQNYWQGIQGLTNVGAAYNPTSYAGTAVSSSNATTNAAGQVLSEQQAGWQNAMGIVKGVAGLASAAAGPIAGGIGNMSSDSNFGENVGNFFTGMGNG